MEKKCYDALASEQNTFIRPWRGSRLFMQKCHLNLWVAKLSLVGHETIISDWFYIEYDYFRIIRLLKYHICYTDSSIVLYTYLYCWIMGSQDKAIGFMWVAAQKGWKSVVSIVWIALDTDECIDCHTDWKTDSRWMSVWLRADGCPNHSLICKIRFPK